MLTKTPAINALPNEFLCEVFSYVITFDLGNYPPKVGKLNRVCKYWDSLITKHFKQIINIKIEAFSSNMSFQNEPRLKFFYLFSLFIKNSLEANYLNSFFFIKFISSLYVNSITLKKRELIRKQKTSPLKIKNYLLLLEIYYELHQKYLLLPVLTKKLHGLEVFEKRLKDILLNSPSLLKPALLFLLGYFSSSVRTWSKNSFESTLIVLLFKQFDYTVSDRKNDILKEVETLFNKGYLEKKCFSEKAVLSLAKVDIALGWRLILNWIEKVKQAVQRPFDYAIFANNKPQKCVAKLLDLIQYFEGSFNEIHKSEIKNFFEVLIKVDITDRSFRPEVLDAINALGQMNSLSLRNKAVLYFIKLFETFSRSSNKKCVLQYISSFLELPCELLKVENIDIKDYIKQPKKDFL